MCCLAVEEQRQTVVEVAVLFSAHQPVFTHCHLSTYHSQLRAQSEYPQQLFPGPSRDALQVRTEGWTNSSCDYVDLIY